MKHIGIVACSAEGAALCYQTICREALRVVVAEDARRRGFRRVGILGTRYTMSNSETSSGGKTGRKP